MDVRQLSYFVAVAEERQFTRAAIRVSVAQPAVSHQIRRLEAELGESLFHRDQRAARLTEAGEQLLPHARAAIAAVERGRDAVASLHGLLRGTLKVGLVRASVDRGVFEVLGEFHRAHPAVEIVLSERHNADLLEALAGGETDAAIVGITGEPLPPQVGARVIDSEPLVVAVRLGHPLARRASVTVGQLRSHPLITLTRGSGLRAVLESACRQAGFTPRITAETSELSSLAELAAEGLGVALLPRSAVAETKPRLAVLELTRPRLQRGTALAWNETTISAAGRTFLTLANARLPRVGHDSLPMEAGAPATSGNRLFGRATRAHVQL
jgi:DNA-binding transcriptional LysR family regulator